MTGLQTDINSVTSLAGRIALVSGGTRGLGLEISRQLAGLGALVVIGGRLKPGTAESTEKISSFPEGADYVNLDVTSSQSISNCCDFILGKYGRLDILINNAGVFLDKPLEGGVINCSPDEFFETLAVNLVGAYALIDAFILNMRKNNYGRIVNISSGMGRCVELDGTALAYRTSKAALNTMTAILAKREIDYDIKVNAVCPGWVRTQMGGPNATRSATQGAAGVVHAASLPSEGFTGYLLRDGERFGCA
ncbi:SDR family NAD(P)-dependent oxidoreductase [Salinicola sp. NYA28a]